MRKLGVGISHAMKLLANKYSGRAVWHHELKPGERFLTFQNQGSEVDTATVWVHDNLDGFAVVHEELTGRGGMMTGGFPVVLLDDQTPTPSVGEGI